MKSSSQPTTNKYFAKVASVDGELNAMRHRATKALFERNDCIIVASVSCIYGLGLSLSYLNSSFTICENQRFSIYELVSKLREINYQKTEMFPCLESILDANGDIKWHFIHNSHGFQRGQFYQIANKQFQYASNTCDESIIIWPPYEDNLLYVRLSGNNTMIESIHKIPIISSRDNESLNMNSRHLSETATFSLHHLISDQLKSLQSIEGDVRLYPASHHATTKAELRRGCERAEKELADTMKNFEALGMHEEAQRIMQRTQADIEMLKEYGICPGLENYSRLFSSRKPGEPPETLIDYFNLDVTYSWSRTLFEQNCEFRKWTLFIDESHVTLPQLQAMYGADRKRKETLIKHGYRLPSALDNRPLAYDEFFEKVQQVITISYYFTIICE